MEFAPSSKSTPGTDGLVHISELDTERVRAVTDILKKGTRSWSNASASTSKGRSSSPARKHLAWSCLLISDLAISARVNSDSRETATSSTARGCFFTVYNPSS